ncbi:hypothetical protein Tco_1060990 [Tanacetum coccineum]
MQLDVKQDGFKQLGPNVETGVHRVQVEKRVWFEVELQGAQGDHKAEVFQVSNDDAAVAQIWLEDKQLEEKTNTDCLCYMRIDSADSLTVGSLRNSNRRSETHRSKISLDGSSVGGKRRMASSITSFDIEKLDGNIVQNHGGSKQVGLKKLDSKQVGFKQLGHKQVGFKQLGPGFKTGVHGVQIDKRVWFEVELHEA